MFEQQIAREAPTTLKQNGDDPTRPAVPEPVLAVANIQGNIIGGFNKDYQTMLFLRITDAERFRGWLRHFVPFVATAAEVLQFNQLFKEIRRRRKVETQAVQATWINIAFSFNALEALAADPNVLRERAAASPAAFADYQGHPANAFKADEFADAAFKEGLAQRATRVLGDPPDELDLEGSPKNGVFGGPGNEPDVVIVVGSDSDDELHDEVARIEESIYSGRAITGESAPSGLQIIYKQEGATLPPPLVGHEHFGFLDGISQPGLRGRISEDPTDVLTLRQNPNDPDQGKPGQDLVWPGEFIFGYRKQDSPPQDDDRRLRRLVSPVWAIDGSFLVVRRLRQDVAAFHKFLETAAPQLGLTRDQLGAKLVGRWPSGAPIMRQPKKDNPALGDDECANNHFEFQEESVRIERPSGRNAYCADTKHPVSKGDKNGVVCPFAAHIRKTYPRDDTGTLSAELNETTTQTHRLLRRGIPFGDPYYPPRDPEKQTDHGNRGLLFAAYMTSIEKQFEFIIQRWVNEPEFKDKSEEDGLRSGHDLIIGQSNGAQGSRQRRFVLPVQDEQGNIERKIVTTGQDWVIPTGGGYFFAPSIDALCLLSGATRD